MENNKESNKTPKETMSIMLNTSPVKTNIPFKSKSPAQKRMNCTKTSAPKASIRNTSPEIKSIAPKILTNAIFFKRAADL